MSAATLDHCTSLKNSTAISQQAQNKSTFLAERAEILETVARKAQDKTLTLQETTDLYARFNQTYEAGYQRKKHSEEDESWALKLLEECARESEAENALQTRVNGEPESLQLVKTTRSVVSAQPRTTVSEAVNTGRSALKQSDSSLKNAPTLHQTLFSDEQTSVDGAIEKPKLKFRDAFIYDQLNFAAEEADTYSSKKSNHSFWVILGLSSLFALAALITLNHFL